MKLNFTPISQKINCQLLVFIFCVFSFTQAHSQAQYCTSLQSNTCLNTHNFKLIQIANTPFSYNDTACIKSNLYSYVPPIGKHSAILQKGSTYSFNITGGEFVAPYKIAFWIDYNEDTIFSSNEYTMVTTNAIDYVVNSVNITIPTSATTGFARLRLRTKVFSTILMNAQDACTNYITGESLDFMIYIRDNVACSGPIAGSAIASKDSICPSDTLVLSLNGNSDGYNQTYQWQSSPDNISWTNLPGENFLKTSFAVLPASSYFRCALECSGNTVYSSSVYVYKTPIENCYCSSASAETQPSTRRNTDIGYFSMSNLVNFSDTSAYNNISAVNNYTDFTSLPPIDLGKGINVPFTVKIISDTTAGIDYFSYFLDIYVDCDQDGQFSKATEEFYYFNSSYSNNITKSLKLPYYTKLGLTRLRLIAHPYYNWQPFLPCNFYPEGETEDYMVNVLLGTEAENKELNDEDIYIYPNPTNQILNISCNSNTTKGTQLRLLNLNGQLLFEDPMQSNYTKTLDVSQYPKGIYVLQVISNTSLITKKVVIE